MYWGHKEAVGGLALKLLIDGDDPGMRAQNKAELAKRNIPVIYEHRISATEKVVGRIRRITIDHAPVQKYGVPAPKVALINARTVTARVFVDCSYEGDLMAMAGISYSYGRESAEEYGESLAGMLPIVLTYPIDPHVKPGDPKSGLLPLIKDFKPGPEGSADKLTQKYCFRLKLAKEPDRIRIEKPENYDPALFEIFRRGFQSKVQMDLGMHRNRVDEHEPKRIGLGPFHENASRSLWSQSVAGINTDYPEGDWVCHGWGIPIGTVKGLCVANWGQSLEVGCPDRSTVCCQCLNATSIVASSRSEMSIWTMRLSIKTPIRGDEPRIGREKVMIGNNELLRGVLGVSLTQIFGDELFGVKLGRLVVGEDLALRLPGRVALAKPPRSESFW